MQVQSMLLSLRVQICLQSSVEFYEAVWFLYPAIFSKSNVCFRRVDGSLVDG